jgi:DNA helicase-2/ATP-dependent DNA helicase PcrA
MDKGVTLAVAGSGKTTRLVASLDSDRRFLIVTYTESYYHNLRAKIIERFGCFPCNVSLYTYFSFLHGFCYRPFLRAEKNTKGLTFQMPPRWPAYRKTDDRRYMTPTGWLYANRLAAFIEKNDLLADVRSRMEKYYDAFFVDEVQDFAGHDFNFLIAISAAKMDIAFVGDFFQHTYDTSRDGAMNKHLHDDYDRYRARFHVANLAVDTESLKKSRRCSSSVCAFITEHIGIPIEAHDDRESLVRYEDDPTAIQALYEDPGTVKLFLKEHYKYACYSQNWGASKGVDQYGDVCVVLNAANVKAWREGTLQSINPGTRNKLYVACSRARGNLTFISEAALRAYKRS